MNNFTNLISFNDIFDGVKNILTAESLESIIKIGSIVLITLFLFKISSYFTHKFKKILEQSNISNDERTPLRAKTISEISNNLIMVCISLVAVFLILEQLGVNLTPIITGAGVLGLAISFGAQSLVKDIISGFFILLEDQYGVGDIIKITNFTGVVENMNLRTTILRDMEGSVHIVPNGEIKQVTVMTKLWSRAVIDIKVFYKQDIQRIFSMISEEADKLAAESEDRILEKPQLLGIDSIDQNGITIRLTIKTKPAKQWEISREFRKRIIERFNNERIDLPFFPSLNYVIS